MLIIQGMKKIVEDKVFVETSIFDLAGEGDCGPQNDDHRVTTQSDLYLSKRMAYSNKTSSAPF